MKMALELGGLPHVRYKKHFNDQSPKAAKAHIFFDSTAVEDSSFALERNDSTVSDALTKDDMEAKQHIEVCVRLRPLIVQKHVSSSSFFGGKSNVVSSSGVPSPTNNHRLNGSITANYRSNLSRKCSSSVPGATKSTITNRSRLGDNNASKAPAATLTQGNLRKPAIPRTANSGVGQQNLQVSTGGVCVSPSSSYPTVCAWHVNPDDTVVQSPETDIVQGRTCQYTLDRVYDMTTSTEQVYNRSVKDLVDSAMEGYHTSVLAYGQTGTGKTHTMTGTSREPGLIPLCIQHCFDWLKQQGTEGRNREFLLRVSYLEVYNEHIRDLLAPNPVSAPPVRLFDNASGQQVVTGLREEVVTTPEQVFEWLAQGETRRQVGATNMNAHSSRSHVMVRLWIESSEILVSNWNKYALSGSSAGTSSTSVNTGAAVRVSSLSLVDLAGSESVRLSGASSERLQEGHYINKSLMTLGKVVYALSDNDSKNVGSNSAPRKKHIPYRDSKLTRLLQPSLAGNAKVVLICCISPEVSHLEESHNTLKFAVRAKKIPQKATLQENLSDEKTLLQSYREEIELLKRQLRDMKEQQEKMLNHRKFQENDKFNHTHNTVIDTIIGTPSVIVSPTTNTINTTPKTASPTGTESTCSTSSSVYSNIHVSKIDDFIEADHDEAVRELVEAIQSMEKLILKSNSTANTLDDAIITDGNVNRTQCLTDELCSQATPVSVNEDQHENFEYCCVEDEQELLKLASSKSTYLSPKNISSFNSRVAIIDGDNFKVSTSTPPQTFNFKSHREMRMELARIQGLLGSVLKQTKRQRQRNLEFLRPVVIPTLQRDGDYQFPSGESVGSFPYESGSTINTSLPDQGTICNYRRLQQGNDYDDNSSKEQGSVVKSLRMQLEQQKVSSYLRKADASFLQAQLEEKDSLLAEVSAILEAVEQRQVQLENENANLRNELDRMRSKVRLQF